MNANFKQFKSKEIIDINDGSKIGYVDDMVFDTETADVVSLVVYGRYRFFGLLGREDDIVIDWDAIETIGEDTILVKIDGIKGVKHQSKINYFEKLFG